MVMYSLMPRGHVLWCCVLQSGAKDKSKLCVSGHGGGAVVWFVAVFC